MNTAWFRDNTVRSLSCVTPFIWFVPSTYSDRLVENIFTFCSTYYVLRTARHHIDKIFWICQVLIQKESFVFTWVTETVANSDGFMHRPWRRVQRFGDTGPLLCMMTQQLRKCTEASRRSLLGNERKSKRLVS